MLTSRHASLRFVVRTIGIALFAALVFFVTVRGLAKDGSSFVISLPLAFHDVIDKIDDDAAAAASGAASSTVVGFDFYNATGTAATSTNTATSTPTNTPTPSDNIVFVTSTFFNGNLGGLAGADAKCQAAALSASLPGTYKALISGTGVNAGDRLTHSSSPYKLVNGTIVANNWADLTDGSLASAISRTESNVDVSGSGLFAVWTATLSNFTYSGSSCNDWSSTAGNTVTGNLTTVGTTWVSNSAGVSCSSLTRLYCVQQVTGPTATATVSATATFTPTPSCFAKPDMMYYKFDGTGTTVPNEASAPVGANPATLSALTQGGSGQFGGGLIGQSFPPAFNRWVDSGWATNLPVGQSWTISMYLGPLAPNNSFYAFGDQAAGGIRAIVFSGAGPYVKLVAGGMNDVTIPNAGISVAPSVVHFVYNASVNSIFGYLNGTLVTSVGQGPIGYSGAGSFKIGGYVGNDGMPSGSVVDEFRMYSRALSSGEIAATWNQQLGSCGTATATNTPTATATATVTPTASPAATPIVLLDTISNATGASAGPITYMGNSWTNNALPVGTNSVQVTKVTVLVASLTTQSYTNVVARVRLWNNYLSGSTPVFNSAAGTLITQSLGPQSFIQNQLYQFDINLPAPITLIGGAGWNWGFAQNFQGDTGSGPADTPNLTSAIAHGGPYAAGQITTGSSPDYGVYQTSSRTDFNFAPSDFLTLGAGFPNEGVGIIIHGNPLSSTPTATNTPTASPSPTNTATPTSTGTPSLLLDTISSAASGFVTGSGTPQNYMGNSWTNNALPSGTQAIQITSVTMIVASLTNQSYNNVVARIQFWNNYLSGSTPVFNSAAGTLVTHNTGPLTLSAFTAYPIEIQFSPPITLMNGAGWNWGFGQSFQGDTGSGPVFTPNLVSAIAFNHPFAVGQITTGSAPNYGYYRANSRTDFNFAPSDLETQGKLTHQGIAIAISGYALSSTPTPTGTPTSTATATNTPTATATATATPNGSAAIVGSVTYGNAGGTPSPRFVSNVTLTGAGSPTVFTTTDFPGGNYVLTGFGAGAYTVTPTKTGGVNGISSFDAGRIALHVAGPPNPQLNATQLLVADVSGNGGVSSFDAGMIAKYVAGPPYAPPGIGSTGTWRFTPVSRNYPSVTTIIEDENYTALLMGEVSGNWTNTGARPAEPPIAGRDASIPTGPERGIAVELPSLSIDAGKEVVIPVKVEGIPHKGVISYEFDLRYDPTAMQPVVDAVDVKGTASRGLSVVTNANEPGLLRVVVYGAFPIDQDGVLLNLKFTAVGSAGSVSPISFERLMFNEGEPKVIVGDGRIELF